MERLETYDFQGKPEILGAISNPVSFCSSYVTNGLNSDLNSKQYGRAMALTIS